MDGKRGRGTIESESTRGVYRLAVYGPPAGVVLNPVDNRPKRMKSVRRRVCGLTSSRRERS
jgi:hypothetical protein